MKIKEFTTEPYLAIEKQVAKDAHVIVCDFLFAIENKQNPTAIVNTYKELFKNLDSEWAENCRKHLKEGRTRKSILIEKLPRYSLYQFAGHKLNFWFHHKSDNNFKRKNYNYNDFLEMCKMEVALLFYKYESVYQFEIEVAIVCLLLKFFDIYIKNAMSDMMQWQLKSAEISNAINTIMQMELSDLKPYTDLIDSNFILYVRPKSHKVVKLRPTCKEDLTECFIDGMTQTEFKTAIMEHWQIKSMRSVERLMQQYGLTRSYNKSEPESQQMTMTNKEQVSDDMISVCAERDRLQNQVNAYQQENKELRVQIEALKQQLASLIQAQKHRIR